MADRRPILIVGAGPVGLAAALFMVTRGRPVIVLEAESALPTDMRASTFHPPTLDMLRDLDVAPRLVAQGHIARKWQYLRLDRGESAVFDLGILADDTAHPYRLQCEQFRLTHIVVDVLKEHAGFQILFDAKVTDIREDAEAITVVAAVGGREQTFTGRYVIGADGAKSQIRRRAGMELEGETYARTSITVVVDFPFERHLGNVLYVNYLWTRDDHFSLMRVRDYWRVGYTPLAGQSTAEALSAAGVQSRLREFLPIGQNLPVIHRAEYTVHRRVAPAFRAGRVLLAGDAAHLNSPSGGMGMNSGIHDARNLADKLCRVLDGEDESLLDLYSRQRRTIAIEETQVQSDRNHKRHREKDPDKRELIWQDLQEISRDNARMRGFLLNSSMIAALRRSEEIA